VKSLKGNKMWISQAEVCRTFVKWNEYIFIVTFIDDVSSKL